MGEEQRDDVSGIDLERPATVFLSYAREDSEAVKDLQLRLNILGVRSWRDVDNMLVGVPFQDDIKRAIEQDVDAFALYITPACLKSDFIWKVEVDAAWNRHKRDPQFHIVPILQGVSYSEVKQSCFRHNLPDVTQFNGISLSDEGTSITMEEQNKRRNEAARRILQAALTLRLRRVKADRNYEAYISLKAFVSQAPTTCLDLDLDWIKPIYEKDCLPTPQEWEQILLPALLDVKQSISEKVYSRRIHLFVKSILPVAVALGFTFREVTRLTLLVEGQKETWGTDVLPSSEEEPLDVDWNYNDTGDAQTAVLGVTTTRLIKTSVDHALSSFGLVPAYRIQLELPQISRTSVKDAAHAQAIAQQVGRVCQTLCDQHGVAHIHLFVVVPVELAVLIGHQFNALCPITLL